MATIPGYSSLLSKPDQWERERCWLGGQTRNSPFAPFGHRPPAFLSPFAIQIETPRDESANGAHVRPYILVSSREKDYHDNN